MKALVAGAVPPGPEAVGVVAQGCPQDTLPVAGQALPSMSFLLHLAAD